jgi:hypothetical protein
VKPAIRFPIALLILVFSASLFYACVGGDDDDDDDCDALVDEPLTDCKSVCNDKTCEAVLQCEDYIDVGPPEDCVAECLEGCETGCIPAGTEECLENFTDCDTLIACMKPLFNL